MPLPESPRRSVLAAEPPGRLATQAIAAEIRIAAAAPDALALIGCGARKADAPARAEDLYTGSYFRACLGAALALVPRERVAILSALYGLLRLDDGPIGPYQLTVGQPGSITAEALAGQVTASGLAGAPVIALCGARYAGLARRVWADVTAPLAGLGIGHQLHLLAAVRADRAPRELAGSTGEASR